MSGGHRRPSNASARRGSMTVGDEAGSSSTAQDRAQKTQPPNKLPQGSLVSFPSDYRNAGPTSPAAGSASSNTSSFVFPVRSVFANMQQPARGSIAGSNGQGAPLSRMASNASNSSHTDNRSSSFAPSEGTANNIRAHAESISQMLEAASHSNVLQGNSQDSSRLGVQGSAEAAGRSNSDSSGTATEGIYSALLPRDQEEASKSYFNLKGRRSSDGSTQRVTPNSDGSRPAAHSPMEVCDPGAAHGQIDPVPKEAHAPGLQTAERSGAASGDNNAYHFSDRPGKDREAGTQTSSAAVTPTISGINTQRKDSGHRSPATEVRHRSSNTTEIPVERKHEEMEPDVGPSLQTHTDMTDIVRLGDTREPDSHRSASEGSQQQERPTVNRHETVDHQQSVRNFVTKQANTVNMPDPNAPTPAPQDEDGQQSYIGSRNKHRSSNQMSVDEDFGFESPEHGSDHESDGVSDDDSSENQSNDQVATQSESASQLSSEADEPVMTVRFEHVTTEDGHHVVVGREGKLQKCEDEVRIAVFLRSWDKVSDMYELSQSQRLALCKALES